MITWHVVHAQLPPHSCSRPRSKCFETSRNDSGLPWFEYGSLPVWNSTVFSSPSMMKVTFGICGSGGPERPALHFVHTPARQRRVDRAVHGDFGQVLRHVVQFVGALVDRIAVVAG